MEVEPYAEVSTSYRRFAREAADSPTFAGWAARVAEDVEVRDWIAALPQLKQQPNLVFAAARWHGVSAPGPYDDLRRALLSDDGRIEATIRARATQTNEVGRLATLLPAFAALASDDAPLALVEAGASAGFCLYPDRWGYAWTRRSPNGPEATEGTRHRAGTGERATPAGGAHVLGEEPRLPCRVSGPVPLPDRLPQVAFRGGVDLNPLDVSDDDAMAWLTQLVWPEQDDRRERLRHAIDLARAAPPDLVRGDLLEELPALVDRASSYGTVVVFHSAVIAYLAPDDRDRFDLLMRGLVADGACHWVSNEGPQVLASITRTGPPVPADRPTFVLGVDGRMVARTHGHGRSMAWTA